jgi:hypothetical protein
MKNAYRNAPYTVRLSAILKRVIAKLPRKGGKVLNKKRPGVVPGLGFEIS